MTQPPYGQGADPYQNPQQAVGGGMLAPTSPGMPPQAGYGQPMQQGNPATPVGDPAAMGQYGAPQAPKSKTALIIAAVVGVLAIGGIILGVVLVNRVPDPTAVVRGDDEALNQLAQSCFDGDMSACDSLFLDSPVGSAYEDFGNTCGGRVEESAVEQRYCVDIF